MLQRQKALLRLVWEMQKQGKYKDRTCLDKLLFVLAKESPIAEKISFYHFYPHLYGPFSNLFYADLANLGSGGYIDEDCVITGAGNEIARNADENVAKMIEEAVGRFQNKDAVIKHVYAKYPKYTQKSKLKQHENEKSEPGICSIGYEKKDIDLFLDLLVQNRVELLVDVRANPFSMNFAFTRKKLENSIKKAGIEYLHVPELGIDGKYRKNLESDTDYEALFAFYKSNILPKNEEKISMLASLGRQKKIALMCFEADKCHCHRGVLAERLESMGMKVEHL